MKKIVVLTTGGTIASKPSAATGLYTSGAMTAEELIDTKKLGLDVAVEMETVFQIPSNGMTFERLMVLRSRIIERLRDDDVLGVVVTHGTDTLEESSYFLDLTLDTIRPVVMTGSQRTPGEEGTDAYTNIRDAIVVAASPDCRDLGVLLLFNEGIYAAKHVKKMHAFNIHAFTAFGFGMLGYVDKGRAYLEQRPVRREFLPVEEGDFPRVEIVKASLGSDGAMVDHAVAAGAAGLVLEGLGRGHVTPEFVDSVSRAVDAGVRVVLTTTCEMGRVHPVYDFAGGVKDLQSRGVIAGHDYDSRKARIKLTVLLAAGIESPAALQQAFLN
jgi:L-asparaginase